MDIPPEKDKNLDQGDIPLFDPFEHMRQRFEIMETDVWDDNWIAIRENNDT